MADKKTMIVVTQRRGLSHKPEAQRLIIRGLGLRRIGHTVTLRDTPAIRGMIEKVQHLVDVEVRLGEAPLFGSRHRTADGKPAPKAKKAKAKA
jgi:large subunit ribosomal protein L30